MKNYYDELEVSKNASKEVIEKVYKVLAKKYHPDMNQGDSKKEAEEKGLQVPGAAFQSGEHLCLGSTVGHIVPANLGDQPEKHRCVFSNAFNLAQFLHRRFQHLGQGAKMVQQVMGDGIGIPPCDTEE